MSGNIKLNVINQTDLTAVNVVICQHNASAGLRANPVAWQVLHNIGRQENRPFELSHEFGILAQDPQGNVTPKVSSRRAQAYALSGLDEGPVLTRVKAAGQQQHSVEVRNLLEAGDAEVRVYKSDRLLALFAGLAPAEVAAFEFQPHIYIGLAGQIQEGSVLSDAAASRITARINLLGVHSADIVISSSDQGPNGANFRLENIQ